jgi:predicted DNA-binding antitoxin AbrB/MazE fold protein
LRIDGHSLACYNFNIIARRKTMTETITVIYEKGVLRPLEPLSLPERSRVEIQIVSRPPAVQEKARVHQALLEAGVIRPRTLAEPIEPISETLLAEAASALAQAGSLSELIIEQRDGR